jgi:hypothetical protein
VVYSGGVLQATLHERRPSQQSPGTPPTQNCPSGHYPSTHSWGVRYERRADLLQGSRCLACVLIYLMFLPPAAV